MRTPNPDTCNGPLEWINKFTLTRKSTRRAGSRRSVSYMWLGNREGLWLQYTWKGARGKNYVTARSISIPEIMRMMNSPWLRKEIARFIILLRHEHLSDKALYERRRSKLPLH